MQLKQNFNILKCNASLESVQQNSFHYNYMYSDIDILPSVAFYHQVVLKLKITYLV